VPDFMLTSENADLRLMQLKKSISPCICSKPQNPDRTMEYVSFDKYDFIDIVSLPGSKENYYLPLLYAAERISKGPEINNEGKLIKSTDCVGVLQSVILYGNKSDFWDSGSPVLYVSFIKASQEEQEESFKGLFEWIENMEKPEGCSIALYYSFGFSDFVLFGKGFSPSQYSKFLLDIAQGRNNNKDDRVVDTISLLALLRSCIDASDCNACADKNVCLLNSTAENLNVGLKRDVGIQSLYAVENSSQSESKNEPIKIVDEDAIIFGRSDVQTTIRIQSWHDLISHYRKAWQKRASQQLKITVTTKPSLNQFQPYVPIISEQICEKLSKLENIFRDSLSKNIIKTPWSDVVKFIAMASSSLRSSLNHGLCSELTLSILPTFIAFLNTATMVLESLHDTDGFNDVGLENLKRLMALQDEYISNLNRITSSTMRTDREYIQAPDLNLQAFEVQPKFLSMYSYLAILAEKLLCDRKVSDDSEVERYYFLISTGFIEDMVIMPLSSIYGQRNKLAVVSIGQELQFDIVNSVPMLVHEISHYAGNDRRKRGVRAKSIFRSIAMYWLCSLLPLLPSDDELKKKKKEKDELKIYEELLGKGSLIYALSDAFAQVFDNEYNIYYDLSKVDCRTRYHLKTVDEALASFDYGASLLNTLENQQIMIKAFIKTYLSDLYDEAGNPKQCERKEQELGSLLSKYENTYGYSLPINPDGTPQYPYFIGFLIGDFTIKLSSVVPTLSIRQNNEINYVYGTIKDIIQAHSEAYSDKRMLDLLDLCQADYMPLRDKMTLNDNSLQTDMRFNGVMKSKFGSVINPTSNDLNQRMTVYFVSQQIADYLDNCESVDGNQDAAGNLGLLRGIYKELKGGNISELFGPIQKRLKDEVVEICGHDPIPCDS